MLEIRPHHILCMRAYKGRGYSEEFSINMENTIRQLDLYNKKYNNKSSNQYIESKKVKLVLSLDNLCQKCPNKIEENLCISQENVNELDRKVCNHFNIKEGVYEYKDLEDMVYNNITEEIFDDICRECSWYHLTNCKDLIINKKEPCTK